MVIEIILKGPAGSGKSTRSRELAREFEKQKKSVIIMEGWGNDGHSTEGLRQLNPDVIIREIIGPVKNF